VSSGTATVNRAYWGAARNSACTIAESCPLGVRHNVRKNSNFESLKFPIGEVKILDKDSKRIFVRSRGVEFLEG
jgi:hypothetical protein